VGWLDKLVVHTDYKQIKRKQKRRSVHSFLSGGGGGDGGGCVLTRVFILLVYAASGLVLTSNHPKYSRYLCFHHMARMALTAFLLIPPS
jgi:hypothetical protein